MYIPICDCNHVYVYMPACLLTISLCMNTCVLHVYSLIHVHIYMSVGLCVSVCVWYVGRLSSRAVASLDPRPCESPPHR